MARWEGVLEDLVRDRRTSLVRYGYLLCGNQDDAEDLVQDALVRTFTSARRDAGVTTAENYVRRAMLNRYIDGYRRRRLWAGVRHLFVPSTGESSEPEAASGARIDVEHAIGQLSPRQRACIVLRYHEDLTVPAVAEQLGLSDGAVKRYLSDALRRLECLLGVELDVAPDDEGLGMTILTEKAW